MRKLVTVLILMCNFVFADVYYVKPVAEGLEDGSSWSDASDNVQEIIDLASANSDSIFISAGVYFPSSTKNRDESFIVKSNVSVFGGFVGDEVGSVNDIIGNRVRGDLNSDGKIESWEFVNKSIFSGDLENNDIEFSLVEFRLSQEIESSRIDNSHHVLISDGADSLLINTIENVLIDGISIQGGFNNKSSQKTYASGAF